jgi:hypothetical protein
MTNLESGCNNSGSVWRGASSFRRTCKAIDVLPLSRYSRYFCWLIKNFAS